MSLGSANGGLRTQVRLLRFDSPFIGGPTLIAVSIDHVACRRIHVCLLILAPFHDDSGADLHSASEFFRPSSLKKPQ